MSKSFFIFLAVALSSCSANTYYIVRHAEKEQGTAMTTTTTKTTDVPLSVQGEKRALALKEKLIGKSIHQIFSTNTIRSMSTARPLSASSNLSIQLYTTVDSAFINQLKRIKDNVLIVGHSNTVDDIVNSLVGEKKLSDLHDSEYGDLFIVKHRGKQFKLQGIEKFGE